jgi:hypothetical protein
MQELVPLLSGLVLGAALGAIRPSIRWWVGALLAVALGVFATVVTGEFKSSWEYVLIDIPLVALAAACGLMATRYAFQRRLRAG